MIWLYGFLLGCLIALALVYRSYRQLREEINHLPQGGQAHGPSHALLGASLKAAIDLPEHVKNVAAVVQFASPGCPICYEELSSLERAYKNRPFPYVCLYEVESDELVQKFLAEFGHLHLQPIAPKTARMMGVVATPLVVMIDAESVVRQVELQLPKILQSMQAGVRRTG